MINARKLERKIHAKSGSKINKIIGKLIKHEVGEKKNTFPEYINQCFKTFIGNKNVIQFNLKYMVEYYPVFITRFMAQIHNQYFLNDLDNNLLAFDYIANVFKQCEEIHSIRTDPADDAFQGQGFMYFDSLTEVLKRINQNKSCKLKRIRIFGKKDLSDNEFYNKFKIYFRSEAQWNLERSDNQVIVSRS